MSPDTAPMPSTRRDYSTLGEFYAAAVSEDVLYAALDGDCYVAGAQVESASAYDGLDALCVGRQARSLHDGETMLAHHYTRISASGDRAADVICTPEHWSPDLVVLFLTEQDPQTAKHERVDLLDRADREGWTDERRTVALAQHDANYATPPTFELDK